MDLVPGNFLYGNDIATTAAVVYVYHLLQAAGLGLHDHVRQQHGKRFVSNEVTSTPDCMAQTQGLLLARKTCLTGARQVIFKIGKLRGLAAPPQCRLELILLVEMILDQGFVAARDEYEVFNSCLTRFIDHDLYERAVDDRQHFLRHGLGGRKKTGADRPRGILLFEVLRFIYELLTYKQRKRPP